MNLDKPSLNYQTPVDRPFLASRIKRVSRFIPVFLLVALAIVAFLLTWLHLHDRNFWDF